MLIPGLMGVIAPEQVAQRHYFLEELQQPPVLWGVRAICALAVVASLWVYWKMKHRGGE